MKVMALNSSPRGDGQSKTGIMLNALVEGMREAGAEVAVVSLSKKTIKPCAGCFSCWTKTPGACIHKDDMTKITQPMVSNPDNFLELGNLMWKTCIAEGITPKEFGAKGFVPRADSARSFLALMQLAFNADAAGATNARMQFNFSGDIEDACYLSIDKGTITGAIGTVDQADLTVNAPFEVWMDIMTKKADGQQMFIEQKYTMEGDLGLLMQMDQFFGNS